VSVKLVETCRTVIRRADDCMSLRNKYQVSSTDCKVEVIVYDVVNTFSWDMK